MGDFGEVETVHDWNALLEACGCCPMPYCPVPIVEAECKSDYVTDTLYWPYAVSGGPEDRITLYDGRVVVNFNAVEGGEFVRHEVANFDISGPPAFNESRIIWTYYYMVGVIDTRDSINRTANNSTGAWIITADTTVNGLTSGDNRPSYRAGLAGLLSQVRSAGFRCDLTTETQATYSGGRWEAANQGSGLFTVGDPPWSPDGISYGADGVYREGSGYTVNLSVPKTVGDLIDDVNADLDSASWSSCLGTSGAGAKLDWPKVADFEAEFGSSDPCPPDTSLGNRTGVRVDLKRVRYRFVVPDTFAGTYFKITWDEVFFPDRDAILPLIPLVEDDGVMVTADKTWEWTGPGDLGDPDSWVSPWYDMPGLPEGYDEGGVFIRNIRYECYRSPYGSAPDVTGIAWTPPV